MIRHSFLPPLAILLSVAGAASPLIAQDTYELRHEAYFDDISTRGINLTQTYGPHRAGRTGFWTTQGKFQRGNEAAGVWSQLSYVIANVDGSADAGGANGGFSGWPGMDTYLRWQHRFPQSIKDEYFTEYTTMPNYGKGSTPNQRMMWAAACKLACETWGTAAVTRFSNASNKYGDPTGKAYIMATCDRTVKYNFDERWAKHYLQYTLGPLRSLADLSNDPELSTRARMTWNWGWMDIASFSFKGRWAIPAGRGAMTQDGDSSDISEFGSWLMFGGAPRSDTLDMDQSLLYTQPRVGQANLVTPPPILPEMLEAATDRSKPFTRRGLARVHETQFATSYITKDWVLYSQLEGDTTLNADGTIKIKDLENNGVPSNDWSSERWAVLWDDTGPSGLTMKPPTGYGWAQGSGLGPHEDVMQHQGTVVGVLNIPGTWTWQYTRDSIPANVTAVINDAATTGRLYLHYSKVLVAITRSDIGNFTWPPASQTSCTKRGFAVECASVDEYPQTTAAARLAAFKADIERNPPDFSQVSAAVPRMIYTTRDGTVLDITYGQGGKINNDPVDYTGWPLNESPWSYQSQMGNMWVFGKDRTLLWNYKNWTEREDRRPVATSVVPVAASVDIDLSARVSDAETPAANLHYRITGAANGSAILLPDGKSARFTPAASMAGESSFTFSAGGEFPDSRFVFHYDYEQPAPPAGGLVQDQSTNDRHATANIGGVASLGSETDAPDALAAHDTRSLRFNSGDFGSAKLSRQLNPATLNFANHDWTFATWFKRAGLLDDDFLFYVGGGAGNGAGGEELQLYLPAQSRTLALRHWNSGSVLDVDLASPAVINPGEWHHVALQFERGSFNTGVVKLYLDGKLVATSAPVTWALDQNGPVFIGGPAANTVLNRNLNGWLDDTVLVRGKLSEAEINTLASTTAAHLGGAKLVQTVGIIANPLPPSSLAATVDANSIRLTWSASPGTVVYDVKRGTSASGPFTTIASGLAGTTFTDHTAVFGTTYHYVVTARSASGESANSNSFAAQLPATDTSIWSGGNMAAWSFGARISFPGYSQAENLANIPLLLRLDAATIPGFSYSQFASASGADLRFTDATGATELAYEIEKWDPAGTSLVWVKIPSLSRSTTILVFWGNSAASSPAYTADGSAWNGGYAGVWHLNSTTVTDSTVPAQNTTSNASLSGAGKIAAALIHNGAFQHAIIPHDAELNLPNNYELSGWFKLAAADKPASGDYRSLFTKQTNYATRNWWLSINGAGRLWWKSSAGIDVTSPADLADGQWHHFSAVHDGGKARLYIDGVEAAVGAAPAGEELTSSAIRLGSENSARWFKGALDEFRVSNVKRSAGWIRAVYDNIQDSAFSRIAPATPYAAAFAPRLANRPASAITASSANINGTLFSTGGSATTVTLYHGSVDGGTNPSGWAGSLALGARSAGDFGGAISGLPSGTVRFYRAFAGNSTGGAWAPATASFVTLPAAPGGLTAVPVSGRATLSWNASHGAASYQLKRSTSSGGPHVTVLSGMLGTSAVDFTAEAGGVYYYVVTASNSGGESAPSAELALTTLAPPATLTALAGNNTVFLSWSAVPGAASYTVRRSATPAGPFTPLADGLAGTTHTDSTAANGVACFYQVIALNPAFESAASPVATASPSAAITAPTGLVGAPVGGGAVLTWSPVAGATGYRVKRSTTNGGPYATVAGSLIAPGFTDAGLINGTTYHYVVSALNDTIESADSAQVSVVPAVPPTVFTTASAGNWSAAVWSPRTPISAFESSVLFNNSGAISSANNLGLLLANKLTFSNNSVNLGGDALFLAGSAPSVTSSANVSHTLSGILTLDTATLFSIGANVTTVSGTLNGNGGVAKTGTGTLVLSGANTHTGLTSVSAGVLNLRHPDALGSSPSVTVSAGAALELQNNIALAGHEAILTGQGVGTGGALRNLSGNNTWAGEITAVADSGVTRLSSDSGTLTLSGEIKQSGGASDQLVFQGNGNIVVTGSIGGNSRLTRSNSGGGVVSLLGDNTYTGQTLVNGGILEINTLNRLAADQDSVENALNASSLGLPASVANATIQLGNAGTTATLRFIGPSTITDRVLNLAGTSGGAVLEQNGGGKLTFLSDLTATGAGAKTLTLAGTSEGELAGAIVDNSATNKTSLLKSGSGLWTLGGANTYSGSTTVNAGTLLLRAGAIAAGGNVTVAAGATFGGSGAVTPAAIVNGRLALTPGTLTFGGGLAFGAGARLQWRLFENSDASGFGRVSIPASAITTGVPVDLVLNPDGGAVDFTTPFWSSPRTWPVLAAQSRAGDFTLGAVGADTVARPASGYGAFTLEQTATGVNLTWTPYSPAEQWRFTHFGTIANSGPAADSADPDGDGRTNLEEFTAGTDPLRVDAPNVLLLTPGAEPVTVASLADTLHLIAALQQSAATAPLSWSWAPLSGPGVATFAANSASTTVTFDTAGTYVIEVTATLGDTTATATRTVLVAPPGNLTFRQGENGYAHDATFIRGDSPAWNSGARDQLLIGRNGNTGMRGLFAFDLSTVPAQATVISATFELWIAGTGTGLAGPFQLRPLLTNFVEGAGNGSSSSNGTGTGADWNSRTGPATANLWSAPGGQDGVDFSSTVIGSLDGFDTAASATGTRLALDLVPGFVAEANAALTEARPLRLMLTMANDTVAGTNVFARLASDDHATIAYRPRLTLGFTANPAPVIATGASPSAPAGAPAALTGAASGATTTLWSLVSGPGTATFATQGSPATSVTFSQPGGYVLRFAASNANGSVSRTLGVAVTAPPLDPGVFADWQSLAWPGVADPATTGPQADPDGDGLANLLEWALHLDPKTPGVLNAVLVKNGAVLEYTYTRRKTSAGSAVFLVEWSDTLGSDWSAAGVTTAPPVAINASSETVTATVSAGPGRTRFVRLRITAP